MLDKGLIQRRMSTRKQLIRITEPGAAIMRQEYGEYRAMFETPTLLQVRGKVATGLGEGRYYISRDGYRKAFSQLLGFDPFPGTLNLDVDLLDRDKVAQIKERDGIVIEAFESEGRTFGAVKCFPATIAGKEAALIFPLRSHHVHVVEVISPHELRAALNLVDGGEVTVEVDLDKTRHAA